MRKIQESHDTLDRLIRGKAPSADSPADSLSLFVDQAKRVAAIAPSPAAEQAHLKTILEQAQLLVDKGEPAVRPASKATGPEIQASGLPTRRRKVVLSSLFGSLTAKLAAAGVAVMMTGTGALAATGSLPDTVQDKFAVAAEVVGIDIPTGDDEVTDTDTEGTTEDDAEGTEDSEGTSGKSSSDDVHAAQDATEPGPERGKAVSEAARQKPAGSPTPSWTSPIPPNPVTRPAPQYTRPSSPPSPAPSAAKRFPRRPRPKAGAARTPTRRSRRMKPRHPRAKSRTRTNSLATLAR